MSQNYDAHKGEIGAPALTQEIIAQGVKTSCSTVARVMRELEMKAKYVKKFKHTTKSNHQAPLAPNLLDRGFEVTEINKVWAGDITYIATECGWLYLAVVIDLYSRKVVGWQISNQIKQDLLNGALHVVLLINLQHESLKTTKKQYKYYLYNSNLRLSNNNRLNSAEYESLSTSSLQRN